ncbi:unnamed protein product [Clavelina lepadiformis]|uniref:ABC transmembrane type-1 domain-containing protein n=1 Tax=Clavelina lepadiformis TaxID=159417 RepID=A0ABP0GNF4_CLALP
MDTMSLTAGMAPSSTQANRFTSADKENPAFYDVTHPKTSQSASLDYVSAIRRVWSSLGQPVWFASFTSLVALVITFVESMLSNHVTLLTKNILQYSIGKYFSMNAYCMTHISNMLRRQTSQSLSRMINHNRRRHL